MKTSVKILQQTRIPKDDVRLQAVSPERDRFSRDGSVVFTSSAGRGCAHVSHLENNNLQGHKRDMSAVTN